MIDRAAMGTASLVIVGIEGRYYLIGLSEKNVQLVRELDGFSAEDSIAHKTAFAQLFTGLVEKSRQGGKTDGGGETP